MLHDIQLITIKDNWWKTTNRLDFTPVAEVLNIAPKTYRRLVRYGVPVIIFEMFLWFSAMGIPNAKNIDVVDWCLDASGVKTAWLYYGMNAIVANERQGLIWLYMQAMGAMDAMDAMGDGR